MSGAPLFLVAARAFEDRAGLANDGARPAQVVLGDTGQAFSRWVVDRAVRALRGAADLVAAARYRWYATTAGPAVDVARRWRRWRTRGRAGDMVGDDPEGDVAGALAGGARGGVAGLRGGARRSRAYAACS